MSRSLPLPYSVIVATPTATIGRARKRAVKKPLRSLATAIRVLASKSGRKLDATLRGELKRTVRGLQADLRAAAKSP